MVYLIGYDWGRVRERMGKTAEGRVSEGKEWERRPRAGSPKGKNGKDGRGPGLGKEGIGKTAEGRVSGGKEWKDG